MSGSHQSPPQRLLARRSRFGCGQLLFAGFLAIYLLQLAVAGYRHFVPVIDRTVNDTRYYCWFPFKPIDTIPLLGLLRQAYHEPLELLVTDVKTGEVLRRETHHDILSDVYSEYPELR